MLIGGKFSFHKLKTNITSSVALIECKHIDLSIGIFIYFNATMHCEHVYAILGASFGHVLFKHGLAQDKTEIDVY